MVNKHNPLHPIRYAPGDLRRVNIPGSGTMRAEAATALEQMAAASAAEGAGRLCISNGYRSYTTQNSIHNQRIRELGRAGAEAISARPGHSEHQTGWAADIAAAGNCSYRSFGSTAQGRWVAENAHRFGFVIRYPNGYTPITGYVHEPWHIRYVGTTLAADLRASGLPTLEQYFGYPAAPTY